MHEFGAHDLERIEQALLADDPQFTARFRRAAGRLGADEPEAPLGPTVVAVDGTAASVRAVEWAARLAGATGSEIRIVCAFRWHSYPLDYGLAQLHELSGQEAGRDTCRSAVDLATAVAPGCRVTGTLVCGPAGPAVARASADAALLVLGGPRVSLRRALLRTSTLSYVLSRGRCAVAVLPPAATRPAGRTACTPHVTVGVDGRPGDGAALTTALLTARAEGHQVLVVRAAGAERSTDSTLRAVQRRIPVHGADVMTAGGRLVDALAALESSSAAVVCDRSHVALAAPWGGRRGRRLLEDAGCPVLLTCAPTRRR